MPPIFSLKSGTKGIKALTFKTGFIKWFTWIKQTVVFVQTSCIFSSSFSVFDQANNFHFSFFWAHLQNSLLYQHIPLCSQYSWCYLGKTPSSILMMCSQKGLHVLFAKLHLAWHLLLSWCAPKQACAYRLLTASKLSSDEECHSRLRVMGPDTLLSPITASVLYPSAIYLLYWWPAKPAINLSVITLSWIATQTRWSHLIVYFSYKLYQALI